MRYSLIIDDYRTEKKGITKYYWLYPFICQQVRVIRVASGNDMENKKTQDGRKLNSVQEAIDALKVADAFWDRYTNKDKTNVCWNVFLGIIELAKKIVEADKVELFYFSTSDLKSKVKEIEYKPPTYDFSLSKRLGSLTPKLDALSVMFADIAVDLGIRVIPVIIQEKTNGGRGNESNYRLGVKDINDGGIYSSSTKKLSEPFGIKPKDRAAIIEYYLESTPKLPAWSNWLKRINIDKHRYYLAFFTASPYFAVAIISLCYTFMTYNIGSTFFAWLSFISIIYTAAFILLFRFFIEAAKNNITLLPDWMLPLSFGSAVLQYELNKTSESRYRVKGATVKIYAAKCPVCGHRVSIASKGILFNKRLVGECDLNPVEHCYSFDFTTKQGFKIR